MVQGHAAPDPSQHRVLLVLRKILAGLSPHEHQNALDVVFKVFGGGIFHRFGCHEGVVAQSGQVFGHFLHRENDISQSRIDDALGHSGILGLLFFLDNDHSPFPFDQPGSQGAVVVGTGQHDTDAFFLLVFGQGPEKGVDGKVQTVFFLCLLQVKGSVLNDHVFSRGGDIDLVDLNRNPIPDVVYLKGRFLG